MFEAFYCTEVPSDVPDGGEYDGCAVECHEDQILIADPRSRPLISNTVFNTLLYRDGGSFKCLTKLGPMPMLCPGGFNTNCGCSGSDAECPMGECECQGQLRVNNDCTYARYEDQSVIYLQEMQYINSFQTAALCLNINYSFKNR